MSRLERSRSDRVLFGVCGGLAHRFGVSSDLVRVGFLLAAAFHGVGWVTYLAAYFLVPEASETGEPPREGSGGRQGGLALVALAVLVYLAERGFDALVPWAWGRTARLLLPALLLLSGALLIWPRFRQAGGLAAGKRPQRPLGDRVIAGVAGGIAREAGIDSSLVRLMLVAATVISWITIPLYALLILVLPGEEPHRAADTPPPAPPPPPDVSPAGEPPVPGQGAPEAGR